MVTRSGLGVFACQRGMTTSPCRCGNRLPRLERVDGRSADFFWVQDSSGYRPLLAYPFQHAFEYLREVRAWVAAHPLLVIVICGVPLAVLVGQARRLNDQLPTGEDWLPQSMESARAVRAST